MRELERIYADALVVIGVHSPKYPAERESRRLREAVRRLEIDHPVFNDRHFTVWSNYAVRAWPTVMFVDPLGKVVAKHEGEFTLEMIRPFIDAALAEYRAAGVLREGPFAGRAFPDPPDTPLAYPGKALADAARGRLFIADTNHNRVVVATLEGEVRQVYGTGEAGFEEGPPGAAAFHHPQGLALDGDTLYVADTENHAIRAIDLATGWTRTVAGTGQQALRYVSGGPARETPLNSPWDVVVADGTLFIAMAGFHQLWMHRIGSDEVRRFAGSGHEGLRDGPTAGAHLAQPSGIDRLGDRQALVFTDSESSALRIVDLPGHGAGMTTTLIGHGLFEFGDVDGGYEDARLQHPLGVACDPGSGYIYVADTYNNTIKRYDPTTRTIEGWIGGDGTLFEPAGLSIADGALYIADTNHHVVRRADLATGEVTTIDVRGL